MNMKTRISVASLSVTSSLSCTVTSTPIGSRQARPGTRVIAAGACYERSDKENGYNFVRLDLATRQGKVWLRQYENIGGGWALHHPQQN